jgi:hypothetical protein
VSKTISRKPQASANAPSFLKKALVFTEWALHRFRLGGLFWRQRHAGGKIAPVSLFLYLTHTQPLIDPEVVPAEEAEHMKDDDIVLGFSLGGEARAYPWWIMDNHHAANDVVGGQPMAILLCEMCSTAAAFDPVVNGARLTFEQRHYFNGSVTLDDLETRTVWSPYFAEGIRGKLRGVRLRPLPLIQLTWGAWRKMHPDTTVLAGHLGSRTGHGARHSIGSPELVPAFRSRAARWDARLPHNTLVLGVVTPSAQRAYRLESLRDRGSVVNDEVGGLPIVVLAPPSDGSYAALAFSRVVDGRTLTFRLGTREPVDEETGSRWSWRGEATEGPLTGTSLTFVQSHVSEWYVWPAHYPGIDIYQHR